MWTLSKNHTPSRVPVTGKPRYMKVISVIPTHLVMYGLYMDSLVSRNTVVTTHYSANLTSARIFGAHTYHSQACSFCRGGGLFMFRTGKAKPLSVLLCRFLCKHVQKRDGGVPWAYDSYKAVNKRETRDAHHTLYYASTRPTPDILSTCGMLCPRSAKSLWHTGVYFLRIWYGWSSKLPLQVITYTNQDIKPPNLVLVPR